MPVGRSSRLDRLAQWAEAHDGHFLAASPSLPQFVLVLPKMIALRRTHDNTSKRSRAARSHLRSVLGWMLL